MARSFPVVAVGAIALAAASLAVAAPQRPATQRPTAQVARTAQKQPAVLGFYEGKTVRYFNYGPIKLKPENKLAPIWTFTNGPAASKTSSTLSPARRATRHSGS